MKRLFVIIGLVLLVGTVVTAAGQTRERYAERADRDSRYEADYAERAARDRRYTEGRRYEDYGRAYSNWRYHDRSFWDAHRDKLTVAAGTGAGAAIGAIAGGKEGALIGAAAGAGGSALYTYVLRDRDNNWYYRHRYYNRR